MAQNVAWLGVGNALVKPAWLFFVTAVCVRVLGVTDYGTFIAALALAQAGLAATDFGLTVLATREVARRPDEASDYFSNLMTFRLALSTLGVGVVVGVAFVIGWRGEMMRSVAWAAVYAAALQSVEHSRSYIRAFEVLRYEAFSTVIERALTIAGGLAGLLAFRTPEAVLAGMAAGIVVSLIGTSRWVHQVLSPFEPWRIRTDFLRRAVRRALPIGVFGMFSMLILGLPPVLLERLVDRAEAGVYGAGYRLIDAGMLLPAIIGAALTPRLSALAADNRLAEARRVVQRSFAVLGLACGGVAAVLLFGTPAVVWVLAGDVPGFEALPEILRMAAGLYTAMSFTFVTTLSLIAFDAPWFAAATLGSAFIVSLLCLLNGLPSAAAPSLYTVAVLTVAYSAIAVVCGGRLWYLLARPTPS